MEHIDGLYILLTKMGEINTLFQQNIKKKWLI